MESREFCGVAGRDVSEGRIFRKAGLFVAFLTLLIRI